MACFLVSAAEAVVVKGIEKHEEKVELEKIENEEASAEPEKIPLSRKLKWLSYMLWGGVVLLAFEHVWHGEVVPFPPFLTAASNPADTAEIADYANRVARKTQFQELKKKTVNLNTFRIPLNA